MKKHFRLLSIVLAAVLIFPATGIAHSGHTDRSGGHRDNKNKSGLGSYHYHCGGYPAHLHDNGVCPYNDSSSQSGSSKGSNKKDSSSSNPAYSTETTYITTQDTKLYIEADKNSTVIINVKKGTEFTPTKITSHFLQATINGETGYIRKKHVKAK